MAKRKYQKRNLDYWNKSKTVGQTNNQPVSGPAPDIDIGFDDNEHFTAVAACGGGTTTTYRNSSAPHITPIDRYPNINSGILPWEESNGYTSVATAIILCQRAYANIAIIRNTIESAVEFSNSNIHIKSSNETVKAFFTEWFNRINIYKLKDMFFREYYRGGNVFMYKFNGKMSADQYGKMQTVFGAKSDVLPIRYVVLNPSQIYLNGGLGINSNWSKLLSTYEIEMLKLKRTEEDKQIYNSLPPEIRKLIDKGAGYTNIYMPLDPKRLYYAFYKKQDYEPLAIPMVFPVLNDVEWYLELKKLDMATARQMEQAILLITNGEEQKPGGLGGTNPENIRKLREIFRNKTLGRVLVADYTTKGEWLIPDIGNILGPAKYAQCEKDIKEGLQSILSSNDEKFANAQIKAKVFIERMKEGQKVFLNNFLLPEIKLICKQMNFKNVPEIAFEEIDLDDQTNLTRLYVRLAELGILTPDETMKAIDTGILPDKDSNVINQQNYKRLRDKGLYQPLLGGGKEQEGGRPGGSKSPQTTKKVSPIGTKGSEGYKFSTKKLVELSIKAEELKDKVITAAKKRHKIKGDLNEAQLSLIETLTMNIIANESPEKWQSSITEYVKAPKPLSDDIAREMDAIASEFDTTLWDAAILTKVKL